MGRKSGTAKLQEFEVRITPTDGEPITKEEFIGTDLNKAEILIVAQEGGGDSNQQLHYHLFVKAKLSESHISNIASRLGRATQTIKGNPVFSVKLAHEGTIGYVVKQKNIIYHNQDQTLIDEYMIKSDQYRRDLVAERKRASRKENKSLCDILKEVEVSSTTSPSQIVSQVLDRYSELGMKFPTKNSLETAILQKMYTSQQAYVIYCYKRNLDNNYNEYNQPSWR